MGGQRRVISHPLPVNTLSRLGGLALSKATFILSTDQFAQICHVNLKKAMCYSLCILLGAPSREEPLEVVLDLGRARSGVQDLLAGGVYRWTREAPGAQPMSVQSVARVFF